MGIGIILIYKALQYQHMRWVMQLLITNCEDISSKKRSFKTYPMEYSNGVNQFDEAGLAPFEYIIYPFYPIFPPPSSSSNPNCRSIA